MPKSFFSRKELHNSRAQPWRTGEDLEEICFPLGGIGTGTVSLSGKGELVDWEIFNRPNKGARLGFSFFTLHAKADGKPPVTKVLANPPTLHFDGAGGAMYRGKGFGIPRHTGAGLPHVEATEFKGEYPFAHVNYKDRRLPVRVSLEAFNPMIPLNSDDSGIPVAIFNFTIKNVSTRSVEVSLAANLENVCEGKRTTHTITRRGEEVTRETNGLRRNEAFTRPGLRGIFLTAEEPDPDNAKSGSMALSTPWEDTDLQASWLRGGWTDSVQRFWDEFSAAGRLESRDYPAGPRRDVGSIALRARLGPKESVVLPVYISWHMPNFVHYWGPAVCEEGCEGPPRQASWKNHYAGQFKDALDVAEYVARNCERLESETRLFRDTFFSTTVPDYVLDAVSSQISTLRSPTCIRLTGGEFYGFEGCSATAGCCEGSCTHVWNYAQALCFLYPDLERSLRETDYAYNFRDEDGDMTFRMKLPLGAEPGRMHAAADGQMGGIVKTCREWKISGDDEWLKGLWPGVKKSLEFAWRHWDRDRDGVMEGLQHNTYDIEFFGPNTMMTGIYLAALSAGAEMADAMGEAETAASYRELVARGSAWVDEHLFNGEYYEQKVDPKAAELSKYTGDYSIGGHGVGEPKYQYGKGCLSDQVIGQWMAHVAGLGGQMDGAKVRKTLAAIFKHNWRTSFRDHANCQRVYAVNDEQGLLLCSWPGGGRPEFPFPYSDEVWPGIEYQVASHMIYEGMLDEGLSIVKGARDRFTGSVRNPYNEFECGAHYARSMASYAVLTALCGFSFDGRRKSIGFSPRVNRDDFECFWSLGTGWGQFSRKGSKKGGAAELDVRYGALPVQRFSFPSAAGETVASVSCGGSKLDAKVETKAGQTTVILDEVVEVRPGSPLRVVLGKASRRKKRK